MDDPNEYFLYFISKKNEYKLDRYQREKQKKINTELNNHNKKNYVAVWLETTTTKKGRRMNKNISEVKNFPIKS